MSGGETVPAPIFPVRKQASERRPDEHWKIEKGKALAFAPCLAL